MSNTLIHIIPKMFIGIQIRAFDRPVIDKCNVILSEEIHSVPQLYGSWHYHAKKSDIGIILKQWDNVPRKNFISIVLSVQIPVNNKEISVKAMCNAGPDQDRIPTPKTISSKCAIVGIIFISPSVYLNPVIASTNDKPGLVRENNTFSIVV